MSYSKFPYQIILIDLGKASLAKQSRYLRLTEAEKHTYKVKYPHFAGEVIEGIFPTLNKE